LVPLRILTISNTSQIAHPLKLSAGRVFQETLRFYLRCLRSIQELAERGKKREFGNSHCRLFHASGIFPK
jgi:hypothetical protein